MEVLSHMNKQHDFNMHVLEFHTDVPEDRVHEDIYGVYAPLRFLKDKECRRPKTECTRVFKFCYPSARVWTEESIYLSASGKYYYFSAEGDEYEDESLRDEEYPGVWYELPDDFTMDDLWVALRHCTDLIPNSAMPYRTAAQMHLDWVMNPVGPDKGIMLYHFLSDLIHFEFYFDSKYTDNKELYRENKINSAKSRFKELCAVFMDKPISVAEAFIFEELVNSEVGKKVDDLLFNEVGGFKKLLHRMETYQGKEED